MRFVINDDVSGMVDNNRNRDFELPLLDPPTEDQVIESRAEKIKAWERRIRQVTDAYCQTTDNIWQKAAFYCLQAYAHA